MTPEERAAKAYADLELCPVDQEEATIAAAIQDAVEEAVAEEREAIAQWVEAASVVLPVQNPRLAEDLRSLAKRIRARAGATASPSPGPK